MTSHSYDLAVLGGGPGGYVAALRAAHLGLKVALVEKEPHLGGTCLHRGCIPTKALLHTADLFDEVRRAETFGIRADNPRLDPEGMQRRKAEVVRRLAQGLDSLMEGNGVTVLTGRGRLAGRAALEVEGHGTVEAGSIVLATGSAPARIPGVEPDGKRIVTSDDLLEHPGIPRSLVVVGAGAVGVEFASAYARFGSQVWLVEMLDRVLPTEDEEVSEAVRRAFTKQGIQVFTSTRVERVEKAETGVTVELGDGRSLQGEVLLLAVGRRPLVEGLDLAEAGVELEGGYVKVDPWMRTTAPGIYAIGDLVGGPQLAHLASAEGLVAVEHAAGRDPRPLDYDKVCSCTYCRPEVAGVGLTEAEARRRGYEVRVGRFPFAALGKAAVLGHAEGFVKVVSESRYDEVLGVHMVGPRVTDLVAEAAVALACEATTEELFRTIHAHPTLSEALMEAAWAAGGAALHSLPLPPRRKAVPA